MGFFDLFKKKTSTTSTAVVETRAEKAVKALKTEVKERTEEQMQILVNEAEAKFKKDQDLNAFIEVLENTFWKSEKPLKSSKCMDLIKYYLQAEKTDTAREYLEFLKQQNDRPADEYRLAEAKILKSESKWTEAITQYMQGYLLKAERTGKFQEDKLLNDIRSSVKKQGWSEAALTELTAILRKHVNKKDFQEDTLVADVEKYVAKHA